MKKVTHYCLAHPCWSGVSGIVAIVSLAVAMKWPGELWADPVPPNVRGESTPGVRPPGDESPENATKTEERRVELPDLSGKWEISTEVVTSTYKAYVGLKVFYEVGVAQTGEAVQFAGEKDAEQKPGAVRMIYEGKTRTPINGTGKVEMGDDGRAAVSITSKEKGAGRVVETTFVLRQSEDGCYEGSFQSEAAATTGTCVWRRVGAGGGESRERDEVSSADARGAVRSGPPKEVEIQEVITFGEFARKHGTTAATLNRLNGLNLNEDTVMAAGSVLYVPGR